MLARTLIGLFALLAGAVAQADALPAPAGVFGVDALSVSGFGTLGVMRSNTDAAQVVRYNQRSGAGRDWDPSVDSILGLQASYRASAAVSATVQALVRENLGGDYRPHLSWAYLRYQASDTISVRLGRIAAPGYLLADTRNIGYLTTNQRPPAEVYASQPDQVDGADLIWQRNFGASTVTAQLTAGHHHGRVLADTAGASGQLLKIETNLLGLSVTVERGPLSLRASRNQARISVSEPPALLQLWSAMAASGYPALGPQLSLADGKSFAFTSLGLTYDDGPWTAQAEYVTRRATEPAYLADTAAWYAMAGYRLGAWVPYYQHARLRQSGTSVTLPADFPRDGALALAVRDGLLTAAQQHSDSVGLRWNLALGRAVTLQLDRLRPTVKNGTLIAGPAAGLQRPVMVLGLTLDFVY